MDEASETKVVLASQEEAVALAGANDKNLRLIEREVGAQIGPRGQDMRVQGTPEQVERATQLLRELMKLVGKGHPITAGRSGVRRPARWAGAARRRRTSCSRSSS